MLEGDGEADVVISSVACDMCNCAGEEKDSEEGCKTHVREKIAVVAPPDAIVQPDAVVVLRFDACVADATMVGTWGAPDRTGFAVFSWDFHGCGQDRCIRWGRVLLLLFWVGGWGRGESFHHYPFGGRRAKG